MSNVDDFFIDLCNEELEVIDTILKKYGYNFMKISTSDGHEVISNLLGLANKIPDKNDVEICIDYIMNFVISYEQRRQIFLRQNLFNGINNILEPIMENLEKNKQA
jgi:predicted RNA-binding protein with PUA domain